VLVQFIDRENTIMRLITPHTIELNGGLPTFVPNPITVALIDDHPILPLK
jgi:hypothetical protein